METTGSENEQPPPAPAPAPTAGEQLDVAALQAELQAARAEAAQATERMRALMATPESAAPPAEDEDDDEQPGDGKPVDPETAKLRAALRKATRESKARREAADRMRAEWEAQDAQRKAELVKAQELSAAAEKARAEAESRYKPATIRAAAVPALLAAGARPERAENIVKLLNMASLDVDASGEVPGLAEQVEAVKAEWPELFTPAAPAAPAAPRAPRVSGADQPPAEQAPARSADRLAAQVLQGG